jgi:hypothetical protein
MEHRGKQYRVLQAIDGRWKWSVELGGHTKSGTTAGGREAAIKIDRNGHSFADRLA